MKIHPSVTVAENIIKFKKQCQSLGFSFDWSREVNTTDPEYYKWTQWIFIQLFKQGLAFQDKVAVNWCSFCKTNLADEEVMADGTHERCGKKTEKKMQKQWLLRITKYAQRLLDDLDKLDYSEQIKKQQINWIGKKEGMIINFDEIEIFTTRPETIDGASFIVLAPEHPLVIKQSLTSEEIKKYIEKTKNKSEFERMNNGRKKTGVFTGIYVKNPVTGQKIPVWAADYVLLNYGTGAIMAVPSEDERDKEFATDNNLPIIKTSLKAKPNGKKVINYHLRDWVFSRQHYWGEPIPMIYCKGCADNKIGYFNTEEGKKHIKNFQFSISNFQSNSNDLKIKNLNIKNSLKISNFKLKINESSFGWFPISEDELPLKLPYVKSYEPTTTGESPLAKIDSFVKTKCPNCGGEARRETDTMPNWAGSNWYFIRYLDNKNSKEIAGREKMDCWLPVDIYQGGFEHTTLHLLYSRFIYKFLFDIGVVPNDEPYAKRRSHGIVLGGDNRKMSKSFGNVINPDDIVKEYGADTLRLYEMFMGPFDQMVAWSDEAVAGVNRFLKRVWEIYQKLGVRSYGLSGEENKQLIVKLNKTIKKVTEDIEKLKFNTAVAAMMEFLNEWEANSKSQIPNLKSQTNSKFQILSKKHAQDFLKVLAPFAPFMTEEIWSTVFEEKESIHLSKWPEIDQNKIVEEEVVMPVQVNGKLKITIRVKSYELGVRGYMEKIALGDERIKNILAGKKYRVIYVPGKILNFVTL